MIKNVMMKILSIVLSASAVLLCFTGITFAAVSTIGVSYSAHVQDVGWQAAVSNGATAGTTGLSRRVEALRIRLVNAPEGTGITYSVHVQDIGWMSDCTNGALAGTTGQSKRVEAVKISLSGLPDYSVEYRVHIQDYGWMNWHKDGVVAGTVGRSLRVEAIEIRIIKPDAIKVTGISMASSLTMAAGGSTGVLVATIEPSDATNRNIIWASDNTAVATVNSGIVTSGNPGTATITATTEDGGKTAACLVTVTGTGGGGGGGYIPPTPEVVSIAAIPGVTIPVSGAVPVTAISETSQYTGTVSWSPAETFVSGTAYTATITLTAKSGYTFIGIPANFFTVEGAAATNSAGSNVVTAVFPATLTSVTVAAIPGVTVPANGAAPVAAITATSQYTGTVTWTPADAAFGPVTVYTAHITLTPKTGFTFKSVGENFFTVAGATSVTNSANSNVVTAVFPATPAIVINIKAIPGVTAPVNGATPVTAITETSQYSGTVSWTPNAVTFGGSIVYAATILLEAKPGYTFTGVSANFFTVTGATSVTNNANSNVVTAVFPATAATVINIAAIPGVTAPVKGETPVTVTTETSQYTGTVAWTPADAVFGPSTVYTAHITLTPKTGYTFTGVGANFFTVAGAVATNAANSNVITAVFPSTAANIINIAAIPGVTAPVNGAIPVTAITETSQYTGTVTWTPADAAFGAVTVYTAHITLTAKTGYTFTGVSANFFTVAGATSVTNSANSNVVTAVFPATAATVINIAAIPGVTAPVNGATPVTAITETSQYTGTVTWTPADASFGPVTVYTAHITLTPKTGFTFTGVSANFFTVAGATPVTNSVNSNVVTAVFPATAATVINIAAIPGVTAPVNGATPVTAITETSQYTGTVTWTPSDAAFGPSTVYTAHITLTPKTGYTFTGVGANFFTVAGAVATNAANSNVITAVFPSTAANIINIAAIPGVTAPVNGAIPVTAITETSQYTGTVTWTPADAAFGAVTVYTAHITLTPKTGFTFTGVSANFFTVAGATSVTNTASSNVVTAVFPATAATVINIAAITGVTAPVNGATPVTAITETSQYTGTVTWTPADAVFGPVTVYTAHITLTAKTGYTFTGVSANFFTVAGATSVTNSANSNIVTAVFPATAATVINIAAIPGVTAPVNGATPVTTITETSQYTGTVTWTPSDAAFGPSTVYTAHITLTAKTGYTFTGVSANFFTVAGATSVTNSANSNIVTAVFPATAATVINIAAIPGVTVPVNGATPVTTITETSQYTGTVNWTPADGTFAGETIYTATITLTPKTGFTFTGVSANFFTVAGATSVTNSASSNVVTAVFPATAATVINIVAIPGVPVPVNGATPVTTITETSQYTGTVTWTPSDAVFGPVTVYTAHITLTPKTGFTFTGVSANFFTVAGATSVTNSANSNVVTAVFPATAATVINIAAIPGVPVPVNGATPVTTITETSQYTGTVTWTPVDAVFGPVTVYTAHITLTAKTGYTFTGVSANFFTVAGATSVTNSANSNVVTAVFPATAATVINIAAIPGVPVPVNGATPVTTITETSQYTGTVTWAPADAVFGPVTVYTAHITLTAKTGYTFTGVSANFFTVAGATSVTNSASSNVVTAVFPATAATVINIAAIPGVTVPVNGATPVTAITETDQYTGTVTWAPADGTFAGETIYTATITLTAKTGYTFTGIGENYFTVEGAAVVTNSTDSNVVTAVFPATEA